MIIARTPLRISIGGGGTDLPSYYRNHGGFVISAAIDRYVYITLQKTFVEELMVKYSKVERVPDVSALQHPIIREALMMLEMDGTFLEVTSVADIPAGTGLGSSGSFTVALLRALHTLRNSRISRADLAEQACRIEIDRLGEPIGKQDQYIAAIGGLSCFEFQQDGGVRLESLSLADQTLGDLEGNLQLFFTGFSRRSNSILKEQNDKTLHDDQAMIENLHYVKEMGYRTKEVLQSGQLQEFGKIMHEHWLHKKARSQAMSNPQIDAWYDLALANGAVGGKLIGAGGGGFLIFYTEDSTRLRHVMTDAGMREVRFRFDFEGSKTVEL